MTHCHKQQLELGGGASSISTSKATAIAKTTEKCALPSQQLQFAQKFRIGTFGKISMPLRNHRWRSIQRVLFASCFYFVSINFWKIHNAVIRNDWDGKERQKVGDLPVVWYSRAASLTKSKQSNVTSTGTGSACEGYNGVYHIKMGDIGGAAGTIFFQFVIGQILYAEKYNLKPWVFLDNTSDVVYDEDVHGKGPGVRFTMLGGVNITKIYRKKGVWKDVQPGAPTGIDLAIPREYRFDGDGVWANYFEPVSDFVPGDPSCTSKPLVTLDLKLITPGIHGFASWAPRCWRYHYMPDYVAKPHVPVHEWLEPQRRVANRVANQYIRYAPHLKERADVANPGCSYKNPCLGLHIRQSDKAGGRRQLSTSEFLPYAEEFIKSGGKWIYLATDSNRVIEQIRQGWPGNLQRRLRLMGGDVARSNDEMAVFDIASHHRTNTEILMEIMALSKCQFLVHGFSAVTESSIWMNIDLHDQSVNLEDPEHMNASEFGLVVHAVLNGGNATRMALDRRTSDWWMRSDKVRTSKQKQSLLKGSCDNFDGILHIQHVGGGNVAAGTAFFTSVLNQLIYADENNLKPWVHLSNESSFLYDEMFHGQHTSTILLTSQYGLSIGTHRNKSFSQYYPGKPFLLDKPRPITLIGNGIWNNYFEPVSDFDPSAKSCTNKPIVFFPPDLVSPGLLSWYPHSLRAWRYDDVPDEVWNPRNHSLLDWYEPMRLKANAVIKKYFRFKPHIIQRAAEVNPINETCLPCLAVHLRNSDKNGAYRRKFPPNQFRDYMEAFVHAGGTSIYIASDSHRTLEHIEQRFPARIRQTIRTQGPYVVRTSNTNWTIHELEQRRHRTNSEVLVDILAMSKCQLLLHGNSAVSEAALYLNPNLHNHSVNKEDASAMSVDEFRNMSIHILNAARKNNVQQCSPTLRQTRAHIQDARITDRVDKATEPNVQVIRGGDRHCRKNAIVYLAQKKHSSYGRDSLNVLLKSIRLVQHNYISLNEHMNNTDLLIFHSGDFTQEDLIVFRNRFGPELAQITSFINLSNTSYWRRPEWHKNDDPQSWYAFPLFSEGYRRMIHWFAIDIWRFFADYNERNGCTYEYIMRFDEDSFLRSPIRYDIFDFMKQHEYDYGFRMCSYEMQYTQRIWTLWRRNPKSPRPLRDIDLRMCGFYNNFFVANLSFFQSEPVQQFLNFVDRQGMIYRRRLGDLMIHSLAVYSFAPANRIHRFLDFTYEHSTTDKTTGCVIWGGVQQGYADPGSDRILDDYIREKVRKYKCEANMTIISEHSLSPTYSHLPDELKGKLRLKTVTAGNVEVARKGLLSG